MDLPNKHFEDFPIEFKKVRKRNVSDNIVSSQGVRYPNGFTVLSKIHMRSRNQYLNEDLQSIIELDEKETMVINAPVGKGKSYAIIQTIKRYYEAKDNNYLIIVASPFVSLVEQYVQDIHNDGKIPTNQIFNYGNLGRQQVTYIDKKIHVVTANTLLGNPGEDSYKNSNIKREYLNKLISNCEKNKRKVIFIFDEIHDTINNFKEEYIFNLWKWKNVTHKNFIISATFTEASYVVIEYLAELTDKKINIVEFPRIPIRENQSRLYLHYSSAYNFSSSTRELVELVDSLIATGKNIDILSYSKNLAKDLISSKTIGKKLEEKFGKINDCTSENINNERPKNEAPDNRFDNTKCNIGTNFKSGVSIRKKNHAYVIILPPRGTQSKFKNYYGIFSSGITSIIQALARQRYKGEIHILLGRPGEFNYSSLENKMSKEQLNVFKEHYDIVKHIGSSQKDEGIPVSYIPLSKQETLLKDFYENELKLNVEKGIKLVNNEDRSDLARLEFPPYKNFKLNESENYFASTYGFFGSDLSAYITYGAFTNQFVNCSLYHINNRTKLVFEEGETLSFLEVVFEEFFDLDYFHSLFALGNFQLAYSDFRNRLFKEFRLFFRGKGSKKLSAINPYKNSFFEQQLLYFTAALYYGVEKFPLGKDVNYSRADYLGINIKAALELNPTKINSEWAKERYEAYNSLNYFREKMVRTFSRHERGSESYLYLPLNPFPTFIETSDIKRFEDTLNYLHSKDPFISNGLYNFSRRIEGNFEKKKAAFYKILLEDFFSFEIRKSNPRVLVFGVKQAVLPNIRARELDMPTINIISGAEYNENLPASDFSEMIKRNGGLENLRNKLFAAETEEL